VSANSVDCHTDIQPFKDEVLCDVAPLDVCDVLLGQPYMWRHHVVYESRPRSVIVTLGGHLYRIPEVVPTTVPPKKCRKVVSHTAKFSFFTICSKGEQKDTATTTALPQAPSIQQKQVDKAAEKCKYSFCTLSSHVSRLVEQPQLNRFMIDFHKLSSATSPTRQATHQDADSTNAFSSPQELNAMDSIAS
jgi:hypothetical protein